jgi:hypothetical protein
MTDNWKGFGRKLSWPNPVTNPELAWWYWEIKGKDIPVTGREGPKGCETSRLPHFLDSRLTDSDEVVSPTRRPPFTPQEDSWCSFPLEA